MRARFFVAAITGRIERMDAATLYPIVTLLNGREYIGRDEFPSVAKCETALKQMNNYQVNGRQTRYSCERHIRLAPRVQLP